MSRYQQIIAALNEAVFELDLDGRVIYATAGTVAWTGHPAGETANYLFADVLDKSERNRFEQALKRIVADKTREATLEIELVRGSGNAADHAADQDDNREATPVELKLAAIARSSGKVSSIAVWLRDLSVEKANEMAANVQGTHLLDLVDHISDACVIESRDGMVEMVNDAFCNLFAVKAAPQSLIGTAASALFENASNVTEKRIGPIYFPMDSTEADELEFPLKSGAIISQQTRPVAVENGIAGRMHLFHPKLKKEARTNDGDSKTVSATTAVQVQLIEKVARELAITVEGAGSAIHRAEQLDLPGPLLEHLRRVEASAQSAFGAIAGLIDFARLESSEIELQSGEFHLRETIAALLESIVPLAQERGIHLKLHIEQDVPEHLIGDGARLALALRNIMTCGLGNELGNDKDRDSDRNAELTLAIAPEYVADNVIHLSFSVAYAQAKDSVRSKGLTPAGTMQLAMARQIIRAIVAGTGTNTTAGKIEIRERKESITYQFTAAFSFRQVKETRTRPAFVTLTGLPVLIVSSDAAERKQLAELARSWRMHVREADDADMAIQLLALMMNDDSPIPLVITANTMPVQDGFMLAFRIKHLPKLKQTTIMMLAKDGKPGDAIQCRENGISAYLRHPISPDQINDAIAAVMGTEDDAEATHTLVTRHSLREAKTGTVLLIDANHEHAAVAAKALRKKDFRAVVVDTAEDAYAALLQDIFDVVVVDPATPGFNTKKSIAAQIRAQFGDGHAIPLLLADSSTASAAIHKDNSEYDGVITKPYNKETLAEKIGARMMVRAG